ncbi:MAG: exodeoxyribonuclease VII large subunit [Elusimicrobiota bacterium]
MISERSETKALSVSELNRRAQSLLESSFPEVWVEGEVSDPRTYPSGHTYFTLKDAESSVSAVIFKGAASGLKFKLEHGLKVLALGRVSLYLPRGQYQLICTRLQPKQIGDLQLAFEQLKKKLASEGLFDESRKKSLPRLPRRIGIVTSLQGAAVRDMLSILGRRFDGLHIQVYPVPVQGKEAAGRIAAAIADFNELLPQTEVLLVGRGGGSLEDLWAFNEEVVARAIAASRIPVVSCVGHETDFTIADFVADLRAPTPSAAAELVVPEKEVLLRDVSASGDRLAAALRGLYEQRAQRADELSSRLIPGLRSLLRLLHERLGRACSAPAGAMKNVLLHKEKDLQRLASQLDALSPLKVLGRGYAIAFKQDGRAVRSAGEVRPRDIVRVRVHDGQFNARVEETT